MPTWPEGMEAFILSNARVEKKPLTPEMLEAARRSWPPGRESIPGGTARGTMSRRLREMLERRTGP